MPRHAPHVVHLPYQPHLPRMVHLAGTGVVLSRQGLGVRSAKEHCEYD
jgi:hypothetical protein